MIEITAGIIEIPEEDVQAREVTIISALRVLNLPVSTGRFFPNTASIPNPMPIIVVATKVFSERSEVIPRYSVGVASLSSKLVMETCLGA